MNPSTVLSRRVLLAVAGGGLVAAAFAQRRPALPTSNVIVFAASSMTDVLQAIGSDFEKRTRRGVRFSFASSAALARQIDAGGPADVFISADEAWMDFAQQRNLIQSQTRFDLAGNRLVLIAPADSRIALKITPGFKLGGALAGGRLALGDPDVVPAGRYAKTALMSLGAWNQVADRLVRAENVRSAMIFVARKEAPLGVVYRTDALAEPRVRILDTFPSGSHPPILYPAALTGRAGPQAAEFLAFVRGRPGRELLRDFGFTVP